ncbi:MAG: pentapeptide repeat-containing protein [Cyanobacteria bacterium J06631_2]
MVDREELLEKYAGTEKDFTGQSFGGLRDKSIKGGIYRETNFSEAEFDCGDFIEVELSFANFRRVRMFESSFMNSFMEGIDFTGARFGQVAFYKVNLTRAIFKNATLSETSFYQADLSYADLQGAKEYEMGRFEEVIFYETIMPDGSIRTDTSSN